MDIERHLPDVVRKRYVRKLVLIFLSIAILVGGIGLITQAEVSEQVQNNRQAELQNTAGSEAALLASWRESQRERTALFSENEEFENVDSEQDIQSTLYNQSERFPKSLYAAYYVSGVDWQANNSSLEAAEIRASTITVREGRTLAVTGMEWQNGFSFADDNAVDESDVYGNNGEKLIAFASPVENNDAVMVTVFDATKRGNQFRDRIDGGYTQVIRSQGEVQFASDDNETLSQYSAGTDVEEVQQGAIGNSGVTERNGEVIAYAPVNGTNWILTKHVPQSNAYTVSRLVTERITTLVGTALLGFAVIGVALTRGTIARLVDLTTDARALARGDLAQDIADPDRIDEIGEVQRAFRETQSYMQTVAAKSDAIADREFDSPVLQEDIPGDLGMALDQMSRDLEKSIKDLEQSNKKLEQFAYIASHDLQEPLRMVSSYMDLLEAELDDELDEETEEYFEFAIDGAERMRSMIDDLLMFSRVQTQADPFKKVDASQVFDDIRHDLSLKINNAEADVSGSDLHTVQADADQLGQVFQNLIKNALEHGGEGTVVEVTSESHADMTEFIISDNGPGIPEHRQEDLFDIFETGGDSDGTGIGLAICQEIINRHGGEIWVESTQGEGSRFHFTIPDNPR